MLPRIEPMLAHKAPAPFTDDEHVWEPKIDGERMLAYVEDNSCTLINRNGVDCSRRFPKLVNELASIDRSVIIDGEIAALDADGIPRFNLVRRKPIGGTLRYYPFDLLYAGVDLTKASFHERRILLSTLIPNPLDITKPLVYTGNGQELYDSVLKLGFEGVMAKKLDSCYFPGQRTRYWLKVKPSRVGTFLVVGYTKGEGWRTPYFGSLILAEVVTPETAADPRLRIVGKVGSGFSEVDLIYMVESLKLRDYPVVPMPDYDEAIAYTDVFPIKVTYFERTPDGKLRHPRVKGDFGGNSSG